MSIRRFLSFISMFITLLGGNISLLHAETLSQPLTLKMEVVNVTCVINNGAGINQQINLPFTSVDELRAGTAKSATAKLMVDCSASADQPKEITVSLTPAAGASAVGSGTEGILRTDLSGIGLELIWRMNNQPASLVVGNSTVFTPSSADPLRWDLSLTATPKMINGEKLEGGTYSAALQVNIQYT